MMDGTETTGAEVGMPGQLLTVKDVAGMLKIHAGTIWRLAAQAEAGLPCRGFPRPLRLGGKTVRWRLADILGYLDALGAGVCR